MCVWSVDSKWNWIKSGWNLLGHFFKNRTGNITGVSREPAADVPMVLIMLLGLLEVAAKMLGVTGPVAGLPPAAVVTARPPGGGFFAGTTTLLRVQTPKQASS